MTARGTFGTIGRMRKRHATLEYPIVIKQVNDFLTVSCPDLPKTTSIPIPEKGGLSGEFLSKVALELRKRWIENQTRLRDFDSTKCTTPTPSEIRTTISDRGTKPFTPNRLAKILGVSGNTIRRAIQRGEIGCESTSGGHIKIPIHEGLKFAEKSGFKIDLSLSEKE